jgi:hypothetical protein
MDNMTAWSARADLAGTVDFTMMFAAHDAFSRDIARMLRACEENRVFDPPAAAAWRRFKHFLHMHHVGEDEVLWPRLRAVVDRREDRETLDAMEFEHARIDPLLFLADNALSTRDPDAVAVELGELADELTAHMRHEERRALPLVERHLGRSGWDAFARWFRKEQGLRGAAEYLPWLLDEAPPATVAAVMRQLPLPARLLYRRVWEPKFRSAEATRAAA